jgi:hypothetical protein
MKRYCIFIMTVTALAGLVSSCKKEHVKNPETNNTLLGKWKLNANFYGTGTGPGWHDVDPNDNHMVQFNADGSLVGNQYAQYYQYSVKDSLLTLNGTGNAMLKFVYWINHDTLLVRPDGPLCIEGCMVRFIKTN